jgi:hypothetical protein
VIQVGPLGYFVNVSITTPIVTALRNYSITTPIVTTPIVTALSSSRFFKPLLDPGGGFTSKTAARRFQN